MIIVITVIVTIIIKVKKIVVRMMTRTRIQ